MKYLLLFLSVLTYAQDQKFATLDEETYEFVEEVNYSLYSNKKVVFTGISTIIAFGAGAYTDYTYLAFIAGCIGTGALVLQKFSTYSKGEYRERTNQANKILKQLSIDSIPDLLDEE